MSFVATWATAADLEEFNGAAPAQTMRAKVGRLDGKLVAMWGLVLQKNSVVGMVSEIRPEMRHLKMTIHRHAKRFLEEVSELGFNEIYALADPDIPGSARWLKSLGMNFVYNTKDGEIWQWQRQSHS